jgi:Xaa-Pro aminopeptidase
VTETAERQQRIEQRIRELKLDAVLVSGLPNVRYLSGFTGSNGTMIVAAGTTVLFTDPRYTIQAAQETSCKVETVPKGSLYAAALKLIARKKWRRIGIEGSRISYAAYSELKEGLRLGATLVSTANLVETERMVKSGSEIQLIRQSVETNSRALERAVKKITKRTTEAELAGEIEYQMRKLGAEKPSFETIVASAERSALIHAHPTRKVVAPDRLLLIDMGAMQDGYASDMTRTLHIGSPRPKARKLYKAVLEAQLAAIDAVRENVAASAVDKRARDVLKKYGFEQYFVHSTGHGLGLEIHEPPRLGKRDNTRLQAGMAITIEPGAYIEGFGGVRIEDTVVVTKTGCEVLTPTPKELTIIE